MEGSDPTRTACRRESHRSVSPHKKSALYPHVFSFTGLREQDEIHPRYVLVTNRA